jgi:AcrR family transcriptional regulator
MFFTGHFEESVRKITMKNDKHDRRSERTRKALDLAFVELMEEKTYDAITVQDIIDRANVGRSTFYAHYMDKEDLLTSQFQRLVTYVHNAALAEPVPSSFATLGMFRHVAQNHRLYKAFMWGQGIEMVFKILQGVITERIEQELARHFENQAPKVPTNVLATYIAGGFLTLMRWWLDNGMPYSPEEINALYVQMLMPMLYSVLDMDADTINEFVKTIH